MKSTIILLSTNQKKKMKGNRTVSLFKIYSTQKHIYSISFLHQFKNRLSVRESNLFVFFCFFSSLCHTDLTLYAANEILKRKLNVPSDTLKTGK
jgi:hypothetical protein